MKVHDLDFMEKIRDSFVSKQSNQFLLTGNVFDVYRCPWVERESKEPLYISLTDYLSQRLALRKRLIITYNIAKGIEFQSDEDRERALALYLNLFSPEDQQIGRDSFQDTLSKSPAYILPSLVLLHKLCKAAAENGAKEQLGIIIEHFESVLPDKAMSQMSDIDRQRLIFFKEWLTDSGFKASPHILVFISETESAVNASIRSLPQIVHIHLPLPDNEERKKYIRWCVSENPDLKLKGTQQSFAELSAGMTFSEIEKITRLAAYQKGKLERDDFMKQLNAMLLNRIGDHIEIVRPSHDMNAVIGNTALKKQLDRVAKALKSGDSDIAPVGLLVSGPNGVGKTYVVMAWAQACERIVIVLKNLRGSYFGETDQIFEKIRNVLEVLGNVIVVVDEADTVFAKPGSNTHDTEQRLFGNVIKMMGDPANRSRIVWVLMTARPDNLAPDLKRSGRCGVHLPIFDPEGDDRKAFIDYVLGRVDLKLSMFTKRERDAFNRRTEPFSPADFNELVVELKTERQLNKGKLSPTMVLGVLDEFSGSDIGRQRRMQTLQAVLHCSRQSLIPADLAKVSKEQIYRELEVLEQQLS